MTTTKYMNLISTLAMSQTMPLKQISVRVYLNDGTTALGTSYSLEECNVVLNTTIDVIKCPTNLVTNITQTESTTYPELPPGYNTPDKFAGRSWVINNVRAVFQEVNTVSMVHYGYSVVAVVDIDTHGLLLTMSGFWSTLPVHIRHRFLEVLWSRYLTMLECYGVSSWCRSIYLQAYNDPSTYIGVRTDYKLMVRDGVAVIFKSEGGA